MESLRKILCVMKFCRIKILPSDELHVLSKFSTMPNLKISHSPVIAECFSPAKLLSRNFFCNFCTVNLRASEGLVHPLRKQNQASSNQCARGRFCKTNSLPDFLRLSTSSCFVSNSPNAVMHSLMHSQACPHRKISILLQPTCPIPSRFVAWLL